MHTIRFRRERHVNAIIDQKRNILRLKHGAQRARFFHHGSGRTVLVAQLHQSRTARNASREICQRTAAGDRGIDESIEAQVNVHQLTFARSMSVGPSRL